MAKRKKVSVANAAQDAIEQPTKGPPRPKTTSEFWEKYKHPKWQEMRLRVMERAGFICEDCGSSESTLNVHHSYYTKGADPWDYPESSLNCLCETCHSERHENLSEVRLLLGPMPSECIIHALGAIKSRLVYWVEEVCLNSVTEAFEFCDCVGLYYDDYQWPWHGSCGIGPSGLKQVRFGRWADSNNSVYVTSRDISGAYKIKCQAQNEPATSAEQSESK